MSHPTRELTEAERCVPDLLQAFITSLEQTDHSTQVWDLVVMLGRELNLPFVDYIVASTLREWRKTLFIRTSYDSRWLHELNDDPEVQKWSYFRTHAIHYLTPMAVGLEFLEDHHPLPEQRIKVLEMAAERGMRAGFSIPLRQSAPAQSAVITFSGGQSRREMRALIHAHGWTLHSAALMAHQRHAQLFAAEFTQRNQITPKQLELIELIGLGLQDKAIAQRLGISISAVRHRMNALLANTGLGSRAELAALAMSAGILPHPLNRPDIPFDTVIEMDDTGTRMRTSPAAQHAGRCHSKRSPKTNGASGDPNAPLFKVLL
ncbi:MAG: helix-turn-helix transcriptional regulator [Paracoccaceae bacterium]